MDAGGKDHEADEAGDRHGRDARRAGKAREKKENWKERGDKKDAWKERRRKDRPNEAEVGPTKRDTIANENSSVNPQDKNPRGNALLSMLRANPPGTTRYTREELLSIGQLPSSRVKPPALSIIIDKENAQSPLLVKPKVDKASRRRAGDGEEDRAEEDYEEEVRRDRRERAPRADRGGARSDGEEEAVGDARRAGGRRSGDRWKEEDRRVLKGRHEDGADGHAHSDWGKAEEPQWDMPDANAGGQGDLADFTLGDIRQAEKSLSGGMSMKDYKASLRAGASEPTEDAPHRDRDDPFRVSGSGDGAFFVEEEEEDEDVSRASRGFGKWFGSRTEAAGPAPSAPAAAAVAGPAWPPAPVPGAAPQAAAAAAAAAAVAAAAPPALMAPQRPTSNSITPRPHEPVPPQRLEPPPVVEEVPHRAEEASAAAAAASNPAGRSILSMLGRPDLPSTSPGLDPSSAAGLDRQAKLSVAELFHLAQGKELPPIPPMAATRQSDDAESAERRAQALQMAQLMWAAAKAPQVLPGSRFPGYQAPTAPGAPAAAFAGAGRGAGGGDQLLQEAYAQAMLGMGQAPWAGAMAPGCPPFAGRGYAPPQPYPYGFAPGFGLPRPGFDAASAQGLQQSYGRLAAGAEGQRAGLAQRPKAAAEKAQQQPQAFQARAGATLPLAAHTPAVAEPQAAKPAAAAAAGADEDDAGCSQS